MRLVLTMGNVLATIEDLAFQGIVILATDAAGVEATAAYPGMLTLATNNMALQVTARTYGGCYP